jgi:hypothetical protein
MPSGHRMFLTLWYDYDTLRSTMEVVDAEE